MKTKFRKSCPVWAKALWDESLESAMQWMETNYPGVNLRRVEFLVVGGRQASKYYYGRRPPLITLCPSRPGEFYFYPRAARQLSGLKTLVRHPLPPAARIVKPLIHELTHHLQYVRGIRCGHETDTTLNELAWLREHYPAAWRECWHGEPLDVGPSLMERGRFFEAEGIPSGTT